MAPKVRPYPYIEVISKHEALNHLAPAPKSPHCTVSPLAKQVKLPFPISTTSSQSIFERLHSDVWGSNKVPTYDDKRYFVTIVDDYSRFTWLFLIHS